MKEKTGVKTCKYCKTEIPAGAKVCPNCRKKQGGKLKFILIAVVAVVVIAVAVGSGGDDEPQKVDNGTTPENTSLNGTTEKTEFSVGDTVEQQDVQVTFVGTTESTGSEYVQPTDGNIFLICEFEIENNSSNDISVSSIANFEAYCDDYAVNQSIMGLQAPEAADKNQLDGQVAAGKKMNGVIVYEVPADYKSFEINVAVDFWASRDIKFVVSK